MISYDLFFFFFLELALLRLGLKKSGINITCFFVRGGEPFHHVSVHGEDALLQDGGVRELAVFLLTLVSLQVLPESLGQVSLHIVSSRLQGGRQREISEEDTL